MTVVNPITGNQVTRYLHGTDRTSISPIVYRNDLLTAEIYPDSVENPADGIADRVEYQYNRLGERVWITPPLETALLSMKSDTSTINMAYWEKNNDRSQRIDSNSPCRRRD